MTDRSEQLHHEHSEAERLTKLERFKSAVLAALAELDGKEEVPFDQCTMRRLEEMGKVHGRF